MHAATISAAGGVLPLRRVAAAPSRPCQCGRAHAPAVQARRVVKVRAEEETVAALGAACSIDDMAGCSLADLEMMYIDALWSHYKGGGKFNISDAQYDRLKEELSWQGSGFPTLRRDEVAFVEAAISFAQGKPVVSDEEYEKMKQEMMASQVRRGSGRRLDVTALLLYSKGQQMLDPAQYEELKDEMLKLGIDVGLKGTSCTLSKTPDSLSVDFETLAVMYGGLGALPFIGSAVALKVLDTLIPGDLGFGAYLGVIVAITGGLVYAITNVTGLNNPTILKGQCPCCEENVVAFFGSETPSPQPRNCTKCGTTCSLDKSTMKLTLKDGPKFV